MLRWPIEVLCPADVSINLSVRSLKGSSSIRGGFQTVASDAGIWFADFSNFVVYDRQSVLLWRSLDGLLEGQLNSIDVPFFEFSSVLQPLSATFSSPLPHSDKTLFSDDTGYLSSGTQVNVRGEVAARAVSMTMIVHHGGVIEPGQRFSIAHPNKGNRAYKIRSTEIDDDGNTVVGFRPVLREALQGGEVVEFDSPLCQMRLATDGEMDLSLSRLMLGFPSVSFVEDI